MHAKRRLLPLLLAVIGVAVAAASGNGMPMLQDDPEATSPDLAVAERRQQAQRPRGPKPASPRAIRRLRTKTWRWQAVMGRRLTRAPVRPSTAPVLTLWKRHARNAYRQFVRPPHRNAWACIHRFEGSWADAGDPYWGGLQMDRGFMSTYAPSHLLRRGWANRWSPLEQMWVGERALRRGRSFAAWPNAARICGLA